MRPTFVRSLGGISLFASMLFVLGPAVIAGSPSPAAIDHLLDRMTFGPTSEDRERVRELGADRYIDEQLDPASIDDAELDRRLAALPTLRTDTPGLITRFDPPKPASPPMPLIFPVTFPAPAAAASKPNAAGAGQIVSELQRAAFIRAVYTKRQLYERTVDFWENHFNVF